jgi:hypothetical protein
MAKSVEESARYVLTIFQRHKVRKGGTVLMANLTLPFSQDGWTQADLDAGLPYVVEKGWCTIGKDSKFVTLTEAGSIEAPVENNAPTA